MVLELIFALFLGIFIGALTGIAPGIHINLVSALVVTFSGFLLGYFPPLALVVFLVSLAMTHTFIDYIPSVFLGAPDEDNFLSILPGHEMLMSGKGYEAVVLTLYGSLAGILIILMFSPLFFFFLPQIYPYAERIMPLILLVSSFFLIYFEKTSKIFAFIVFILSGLLGLASMNLPVNDSLLPLFTGLFGISSLLTSISKKQKIPKQKISKLKTIRVSGKSFFKSISASILASPLCSFLPGMGSGQAAVIGSEIMGDLNRKEFLILLGSINTIVTGLSFITLYTINKARTGVAAAVGEILSLNLNDLYIITAVILISGFLSFILTIYVSKFFSRIISKVNYSILSASIIFILIALNFYLVGFLGLLILLVSTLLGSLCIHLGVRRTHLLGSLIIPAIVFYLI